MTRDFLVCLLCLLFALFAFSFLDCKHGRFDCTVKERYK